MTKILIIAAAMGFASLAQAADYRAEADAIANEIVAVHPRGAEIAATPDFIAARAALVKEAADTDLPHYAIALGRLFHAADDGHTAAVPIYGDAPFFTARYPLKLKRFKDGLYVVAAKGDAAPLLGARVTAIGGRKIDALLRDFVAAQAAGNRAWPTNWTALGVTIPGYLIGLDAAPDLETPVAFEAMTITGRRKRAMLVADDDGATGLAEIGRAAPPLAANSDGAGNFVTELDGGAALAFVIGAMEDEEKKSFEAFTREAFAALAATKAERLIVDLRDNGGGNNMLAEALRRAIGKSRFNRLGGLYVLTSAQTFSAAQNFATRLERETDALFVGEPTGGAPNHFGDAKFAKAPQSGIPYLISTLRWQDSTPMDKRAWILPDIPAPPRFSDYVAGRDLALERALADATAAPADDWRTRVAQPWNRPSQKQEWRCFFEAR